MENNKEALVLEHKKTENVWKFEVVKWEETAWTTTSSTQVVSLPKPLATKLPGAGLWDTMLIISIFASVIVSSFMYARKNFV